MKGSKLLILSLCIALSAISQAQKHTNIDYLAFGYDIYRGNPHSSSSGVDPGFKFEKIFDLTYNNGMKSSDGAWDVPDSVTMARTDACTLNFQSSDVSTMSSYQKSLEVEVTVSGGVAEIATFKASTDYKSMEKSTTTTSDKHIYSAAVCDVYRAKMSAYNPPKLHPEFIYALKTLPTNYDESAYLRFLKNFGTHALLEINMGARYGMMSSISEKSWEKFNQEGITVTAAASVAILGISGGVDTRTSNQKEWANKYNSAITNYQIISVGAKPVAGGDGVSWAQQAITQPMPLRYSLIPLSELLTPLYVRDTLEANNMNALQNNLQTALKSFCNSLKKEGLLSDCNKATDVKPQPKINACRWCANSCGAEYPVDGGQFSNDQNWPNWQFSFNTGCTGSYGNMRINSGVHLCCQETGETRKGQCRVCSSCGGDFPEYVGAGQVDQGWEKFTVAYDNSCQGTPRARGNPGGGLKLCCQADPICSMCSSCGGAWPHETGVLGADTNWPDFWRGRGHGCSGGVARNDVNRGMKWCCKTTGTSMLKKSFDFLDFLE